MAMQRLDKVAMLIELQSLARGSGYVMLSPFAPGRAGSSAGQLGKSSGSMLNSSPLSSATFLAFFAQTAGGSGWSSPASSLAPYGGFGPVLRCAVAVSARDRALSGSE